MDRDTLEKTQAAVLRDALKNVLWRGIGSPRQLARRMGITLAEARRIWKLSGLPEN